RLIDRRLDQVFEQFLVPALQRLLGQLTTHDLAATVDPYLDHASPCVPFGNDLPEGLLVFLGFFLDLVGIIEQAEDLTELAKHELRLLAVPDLLRGGERRTIRNRGSGWGGVESLIHADELCSQRFKCPLDQWLVLRLLALTAGLHQAIFRFARGPECNSWGPGRPRTAPFFTPPPAPPRNLLPSLLRPFPA